MKSVLTFIFICFLSFAFGAVNPVPKTKIFCGVKDSTIVTVFVKDGCKTYIASFPIFDGKYVEEKCE